MSERRCPSCGGLVGADAEWCTQCFARLDRDPESDPRATDPSLPSSTTEDTESPTESSSAPLPGADAGGAGDRMVRSSGESIVWDCPACGTENPVGSWICSACGTAFRSAVAEPKPAISVDARRAANLSLFFPGVGHFVVGRKGEAFARGIVFAFALVTGLVSLAAVRSGTGGAYLMLMVLGFGSAFGLYVVTTVDAARAAERQPPMLSTRLLLYGGVGLILLTLVVVTVTAVSARG